MQDTDPYSVEQRPMVRSTTLQAAASSVNQQGSDRIGKRRVGDGAGRAPVDVPCLRLWARPADARPRLSSSSAPSDPSSQNGKQGGNRTWRAAIWDQATHIDTRCVPAAREVPWRAGQWWPTFPPPGHACTVKDHPAPCGDERHTL